MKRNPTKIDILKTVMKGVEKDVSNEDMIHLILQRQFSKDTDEKVDEQLTFGQKAADAITRFTGSWTFIILFILMLLIWMGVNVYFLANPFDPYPFILLNLVLSCVAALQAPLIMMSQNRQEEKDRERAQNDYIVNLKSEIIVEDLHRKIDQILRNEKRIIAANAASEKSNAVAARANGAASEKSNAVAARANGAAKGKPGAAGKKPNGTTGGNPGIAAGKRPNGAANGRPNGSVGQKRNKQNRVNTNKERRRK